MMSGGCDDDDDDDDDDDGDGGGGFGAGDIYVVIHLEKGTVAHINCLIIALCIASHKFFNKKYFLHYS